MRLFAASLATETNTFSAIPTSLQSYKEGLYLRPGEHPQTPSLCTAPLWVARGLAVAEGFELVEGSCFWAEPAGRTARVAYEQMRDEILGQLERALPVDGVVLGLHGAMVAHGYDDCEGDLLGRVRRLVGPKTVIGVELDPHCHMTKERVAHADIIVTFKEFPHTDFVERGEEVVRLTLRAVKGEIRPVRSLADCRMIASFPTTIQPMRGFVDRIKELEGKDGVLSVSVAHGFPYADVPEVGARILVVTDDRKAEGDRLALTLAEELFGFRGRTMPPYLTPDQAIDRSMAGSGTTVLADPADNPGGGAPADSTIVLRRLIERGVEPAALGPLWDPMAVRFCFDAGEGTRFALRFGGKVAPQSGAPVDAEVTVTRLVEDAQQTFGAAKVPLGPAAAVRIGDLDLDLVLITNRTQALGTDLFTGMGIDLATKRLVVVKSTNHFHAAFAKIASEVLYTDSGGPIPRDHRKIPFTKARRPIWPLDEDARPVLIA
jgi:microcystin degradation protein MlrC